VDLEEVGCGSMSWINLAQDRDRWRELVNAVRTLRVSYNAGNLTTWEPVSFSRRALLHGVSTYIRTSVRACTSSPSVSRSKVHDVH
jgi:hypothetical protein